MSSGKSQTIGYLIGFSVSIISSMANALGLNLLQKDFVQNEQRPPSRRRREFLRPGWYLGLALYIGSQLFGNTIALNFLKTQWVAPLGAVALIFNFIFARIFVGIRITRKDLVGTAVVVASVVWIVVFGGMNGDAADHEDNLSLNTLKILYLRLVFIIYFVLINLLALLLLGLSEWARRVLSSREKKIEHPFFRGVDRPRLLKWVGMAIASCGGLVASETLLLAKSGIKLLVLSFEGTNQFKDTLSVIILILLIITAIMQIYCLNTGLKLAPSVLIVPTFFGVYTAFSIINTIIYLDQASDYEPWVLALVALGCIVLMYGVKLLSADKGKGNVRADDVVTSILADADTSRGDKRRERMRSIRAMTLDGEDESREDYHEPDSQRRTTSRGRVASRIRSTFLHREHTPSWPHYPSAPNGSASVPNPHPI